MSARSNKDGTRVPRLAGALLGLEAEYETLGGRTVVRTTKEGGRRKRLLIVRGTQQSALWLDDPFGEPPFPYLRLFDRTFCARPRPRNILMIGGAGYSWPRHALSAHPEIKLTVVEIDPMMNVIAHSWFFLDVLEQRHGPRGDGRLQLIVSDGASHLESCASAGVRYDAILNDTFVASRPAHSLMDDHAASLIHRCLTPGGVYLCNIVSALAGPEATVLNDMVDLLAAHFAQVSVVPCSLEHLEDPSNNIVIASDGEHLFPGTWMTYSAPEAW